MIYGVFGLPRSGKTTYLAKLARKAKKKGTLVFSNFPCEGCYQLRDINDLGTYLFEDCIILIDEISLICDSRDWKNFGDNLKYFFTNHGHYNVDVYYCSQWFTDTDIKIRRMTEELYYIQRLPFGFSARFQVVRDITTADNGEIKDSYSFKRPKLYWRRPYYKMFNSFSRRPLPPYNLKEWK